MNAKPSADAFHIDRETYDLLYEAEGAMQVVCNQARMGAPDPSYEAFRNNAAGYMLRLDDLRIRVNEYLQKNYPPTPKAGYKPRFP